MAALSQGICGGEVRGIMDTMRDRKSFNGAPNAHGENAGGGLSVSVSVGAVLARSTESPEDVVRRADQLMCRSKRAGRDRVTTDTDA